jgi:hypothetical protein
MNECATCGHSHHVLFMVRWNPRMQDFEIIPHPQGNLCASCAEEQQARMRIRLRLNQTF